MHHSVRIANFDNWHSWDPRAVDTADSPVDNCLDYRIGHSGTAAAIDKPYRCCTGRPANRLALEGHSMYLFWFSLAVLRH